MMRYATTQFNSVAGLRWRMVFVKRAGHVSDTEYGAGNLDPTMDGWWCYHVTPPHVCVLKFFFKEKDSRVESF